MNNSESAAITMQQSPTMNSDPSTSTRKLRGRGRGGRGGRGRGGERRPGGRLKKDVRQDMSKLATHSTQAMTHQMVGGVPIKFEMPSLEEDGGRGMIPPTMVIQNIQPQVTNFGFGGINITGGGVGVGGGGVANSNSIVYAGNNNHRETTPTHHPPLTGAQSFIPSDARQYVISLGS